MKILARLWYWTSFGLLVLSLALMGPLAIMCILIAINFFTAKSYVD